jgi:Na+/proline symporter
MRKYTGIIMIAVFLLAILVGVFWNQITRVDAIAIGVFVVFGLIGLFVLVRSLFYKDIDWNRPNLIMRPFLPPTGEEKPHSLSGQNELRHEERQEN